MSTHKFNEYTILTNSSSFWEFESLEAFKKEVREDNFHKLIGYFPPCTNIVYKDLKEQNEEHWMVCYIDLATGEHLIKLFNSKLELLLNLNNIKGNAYSEDHVSIFKTKDFVYYNEEDGNEND